LQSPAKENGYYIVLAPSQECRLDESSLAEAASSLRLKVTELNRIINFAQPLPLTRMATLNEATTIANTLRALGIESMTVPNEDLHLGVAPKKIRALELTDSSLIAIPVGGTAGISARWDDVILLVAGRLLSNRMEVEERRRRGRNQTVDTRQLSSDESVIDLYTKTDEVNWRTNASSFDFSCLGSTKSVTAFANFTRLIKLLRERATNAQFDESYVQLRQALAIVWPLGQETKKGEWRRSRAGKFNMATVTRTDNEAQFTRYSRLRQYLRLRELEDGR